MIQKLRVRFTVICTLVTSLVLLCCLLLAYSLGISLYAQGEEKILAQYVNDLSGRVQSGGAIDFGALADFETRNQVVVGIEDGGTPLLHGQAEPGEEARGQLLEEIKAYAGENGFDPGRRPESIWRVFAEDLRGGQVAYRGEILSLPIGDDGWANVMVFQDYGGQRAEEKRLMGLYGSILLAGVLVLTLLSWLLSRLLARPVQASVQKQKEFIAAASHELRAPLAVISSSAEMAKEKPREDAPYMDTILSETKRMARLTGELLYLAGADAGKMDLAMGEVSPDTLLIQAFEQYEPMAQKSGHTLRLVLPEVEVQPIRADSERLLQLIGILLANAFEYTPEGTPVEMVLKEARQGVQMEIADHGPGIPDSEKEQVFERFRRADTGRASREHYGLGLSVAREIVANHGAKIGLRDTPGGGATFVLIFQRGA